MCRILVLAALLTTIGTTVLAQSVNIQDCIAELKKARPDPAVTHIVTALKEHSIVFIGELHDNKQLHEFYAELVESKTAREHFDDLFVEFLSSFHQDLIDRYVLDLQPMSFEDLAPAWRDVPGIILSDDDNMAAYDLIEVVRRTNESLPRGERIRLLAGDSNLDWSRVANRRDWGTSLNRRDRRFLEVLWDEVLDRNRHAIAILGLGHVKYVDPSPPGWINLVTLVEKRSPGSSYIIHVKIGRAHV